MPAGRLLPSRRRRASRIAPPRGAGWALAFGILAASSGCAHVQAPPPTAAAPPLVVRSDDDYVRIRATFELLPTGDPARGRTRSGLLRFIERDVHAEVATGRYDEAWESFVRALGLWEPEELNAPSPDAAFAGAAAELEAVFSRRGAHHETITLLALQIALAPDDREARARFDQVMHWVRGDGPADRCDRNCEQLTEDFETSVAAFPSPFLVEKLAALYWQRQAAGADFSKDGVGTGGTLARLMQTRTVSRTGVDLARLYLRVSRPDLALTALEKLRGQVGEDPPLRDALARYLSPSATAIDGVLIAAAFARDPANRAVGERVCLDVAQRFSSAAEPQLCIGELAIQLDQITVALRAFERAIQLDPERRDAWESLARLHQARLAQLVGDDRTSELESQLAKVESFHQEAARRFPDEPLRTSLSGALFEAGHGLYNAGRIDDAVRLLLRSQSVQQRPDTFEQRALIELKRERGPEAVALFREGIDFVKQRRGDRDQQAYWLGKLNHGLGDAYEQLGSTREAVEARQHGVEAWDTLLQSRADARLEPDERAEAEIERGKLLYLLGEHDKAFAGFERAMDSSSERGATYADVLSFLAPRGERGPALDVYHRAIGRSGISEYLKVYTSLWIVELDRRAGAPTDPVADGFLSSVSGARWYHDLARWASARETEAELRSHADTPAKLCEADFYLGLHRLGEHKTDEARALFRKVLASQMMGFFEFEMASLFLRHPPAAAPETGSSTTSAPPSAPRSASPVGSAARAR